MITLIIGTPDSGKSRLAEDMALELSGDGKRIYIATMIPFGEEGEKRIARHRKMREGKGFLTMECPYVSDILEALQSLGGATCLLECMSNLVGNEMHTEDGMKKSDSDLISRITSAVSSINGVISDLIIVTNEFELDDPSYDEDTRKYVRLMHETNLELKKQADKTIELVGGEWVTSENN
ncbi:MAG: bifunctional adenosylcobinamide kinase/adenosylcobinamide-phosphate guanylyltransferase [Butyrivibrio sp.]|nr:bifunctional adenosylcobinamide kinase/adenosylcobinamide-phosphate guanylyltransferase [Butyrivibrio sp.]